MAGNLNVGHSYTVDALEQYKLLHTCVNVDLTIIVLVYFLPKTIILAIKHACVHSQWFVLEQACSHVVNTFLHLLNLELACPSVYTTLLSSS